MNRNIALVTYEQLPELDEGDQLLKDALEKKNYEVHTPIWDDSSVDWSQYDFILIRSTWDYYKKFDTFRRWIDQLEQLDCEIWNPPDVLKWNTRKWYYRELRETGVPIIPTTFVPKGVSVELDDVMREKKWNDVIVKPMVGAGSHRLFRTDLDNVNSNQDQFQSIVHETGALVQPFQSSIRDGEWSMVFFLQDYAYAIKKEPRPGEFKAHGDYDASFTVTEPQNRIKDKAKTIVRKINKPWLYLRLDFIVSGNEIRIMEVEMTEPNLYLNHYPTGADEFSKAIEDLLTGERNPDQGGLGFTMGH